MVIDCIVIVIMISHFFYFARLQVVLHDSTYVALGLSDILDQATERLGYDWEYCTGNLSRHTTEGRQFCLRITNRDNGRSVGYIYGRPVTGLLRHERVQSYGHWPSSMDVVTESMTSIDANIWSCASTPELVFV